MSRRAGALLVASSLIQVGLATLPDTMGDLLHYRAWTRALVYEGLAEAYWPPPVPEYSAQFRPPVDYPPLFPYLLWLVGRALAAISPEALAHDDRLLDLVIRLPLCASLLLLAVLAYLEARRTAPGTATLALALIALNPALIFATAYWGQADAPCALLVAAALVALVRGRPEWSWAGIAAAALLKPLAYPFAPLVTIYTLKRFGPRRTLRSAGAAALMVGLALLPFASIGRSVSAVQALFLQLEAMPWVSVNAHNLWWLLGRGVPWTDAATRPLGLVSLKTLSVLLFGSFYLATLLRLWRSSEARALYVAAASTAFGFFVLSTHMHENHLFYALAPLALAGPGPRRIRTVLLLLTVTLLGNMLLHDPFLTHVVRPHVPGPHLLLPQQAVLPAGLGDYLASHGYPWVFEEIRGETSLLGLVLTIANAQANVLIFAAWLAWTYGGRSFDGLPGDISEGSATGRTKDGSKHSGVSWDAPALRLPRLFWPAALLFVAGSGVPFVSRALRYPEEHVFLLRFREAEVKAEAPERVGISSFEIEGERRMVLYVHPPSEVRYRVTPPPRAVLRFGLAVQPEAWSPDKGDGVLFEVRVGEGAAQRVLLSRYVDPKANPSDRRWHDIDLDLSAFAGREVVLTFATAGGPSGNVDYDWAGFSDPVLTRR